MPYRRPSHTPQAKEIITTFEAAIKGLVQRFRAHPYVFYTESDMHCYLYHRLYRGGLANGLFKTAEGHDTILLHKEYPTAVRFRRLPNGVLQEDASARRRGAFDISIWDSGCIKSHTHRDQRVLCAAELALNQCQPGCLLHTINDTIKLATHNNAVKYGYLLFFVRDDPSYERNKNQIWKHLESAARQIRVLFARVHEGLKPRPVYLGKWGVS